MWLIRGCLLLAWNKLNFKITFLKICMILIWLSSVMSQLIIQFMKLCDIHDCNIKIQSALAWGIFCGVHNSWASKATVKCIHGCVDEWIGVWRMYVLFASTVFLTRAQKHETDQCSFAIYNICIVHIDLVQCVFPTDIEVYLFFHWRISILLCLWSSLTSFIFKH